MSEHPVPCLCCGKTLENAFPDSPLQPLGATAFTTSGHFGSGVFDPVTGYESLQVSICDECLTAAAIAGRVLHLTLPLLERQPDPVAAVWKPPAL